MIFYLKLKYCKRREAIYEKLLKNRKIRVAVKSFKWGEYLSQNFEIDGI